MCGFMNEEALRVFIRDKKVGITWNLLYNKVIQREFGSNYSESGWRSNWNDHRRKNIKTEDIIYESADLIYHLLVLLVSNNIELFDIVKELRERNNTHKQKKNSFYAK